MENKKLESFELADDELDGVAGGTILIDRETKTVRFNTRGGSHTVPLQEIVAPLNISSLDSFLNNFMNDPDTALACEDLIRKRGAAYGCPDNDQIFWG